MIYVHKELELADVERCYPAEHYVLVDDKLRILTAVKEGEAPVNDNTRPLLEIIAKYTNLPLQQVVGNCAYVDPEGRLDEKDVANQIAWMQDQGFVDKGVSLQAIIAKEFVKPY